MSKRGARPDMDDAHGSTHALPKRVRAHVPFGHFMGNAVRRSLLSDATSVMADKLLVHENTSSQPHEVIAQRIGLLRFSQSVPDAESDVDACRVDVLGRDVLASDLVGSRSSLDGDAVMAMQQREDQIVRASISFRRSNGEEHARFCPVSAVSCVPDPSTPLACVVSFEPIFEDDARRCYTEACEALLRRVRRARKLLTSDV